MCDMWSAFSMVLVYRADIHMLRYPLQESEQLLHLPRPAMNVLRMNLSIARTMSFISLPPQLASQQVAAALS